MSFPARDWVTTKLLHLESDINGLGWDNPPVLGVLCDIPDDKPGIGVLPFEIGDEPLGLYLHALGKALLQAPDSALKAIVTETPFPVALVLISEAWMSEIPREARDGRRIADIPGSVEVRQVNALDLLGRQYHLLRQRGQQPVDSFAEEGMTLGGLLPAALRDILLALARQLPGYEQGVKTLESLTFTTEL